MINWVVRTWFNVINNVTSPFTTVVRWARSGFGVSTAIIAAFQDVIDFIVDLPSKIAAAIGNIASTIKNGLADIGGGLIGSVGGFLGFQEGVRNFRGGLAVVGEAGPELVSLPRGSNVYSNSELAADTAGRGRPSGGAALGVGRFDKEHGSTG